MRFSRDVYELALVMMLVALLRQEGCEERRCLTVMSVTSLRGLFSGRRRACSMSVPAAVAPRTLSGRRPASRSVRSVVEPLQAPVTVRSAWFWMGSRLSMVERAANEDQVAEQ